MLNPEFTAGNLRRKIYGDYGVAVQRCNDALAIMFEEELGYIEIVDFPSEESLLLASDMLTTAGFIVDVSPHDDRTLEVSV